MAVKAEQAGCRQRRDRGSVQPQCIRHAQGTVFEIRTVDDLGKAVTLLQAKQLKRHALGFCHIDRWLLHFLSARPARAAHTRQRKRAKPGE
jgi:hypothetical protein